MIKNKYHSILSLSTLMVFIFQGLGYCATYTSADRRIVITASTIQYSESGKNFTVTATGNVYVKASNTADRTFIELNTKAIKMLIKQSSSRSISGLDLVEKADFTGPVSLTYTTADNIKRTTTNASADNMSYNGSTNLLEMNGNVKIHQTDSLGGSATAVGNRAFYNTKKILSEEEFRFRIESSPEPSRVEIIPPTESE